MTKKPDKPTKLHEHPFRSAVLRGMGLVAPPLLTIVIFLWVGGTIDRYVLKPMTVGLRDTLVWAVADIREEIPNSDPSTRTATADSLVFYRLGNDDYVPLEVYDLVRKNQGDKPLPRTGYAVYQRYVELQYLSPYLVVPAFVAVFVLLLYLLGKFIAAGIGRFFWGLFERGIHQLPLIRNVYSSVKQVSDFLFSPREIEYTRVVAVEYPRRGIWSLGMVTGESLLDIRSAANEPVLSVLIPTSPMPVTGYTITVPRSETIDLNISIDQAFQFIVSCGVVIPPQQLQHALDQNAAAKESNGSSSSTTGEVVGSEVASDQ